MSTLRSRPPVGSMNRTTPLRFTKIPSVAALTLSLTGKGAGPKSGALRSNNVAKGVRSTQT
jgi:hypothetical protein